MSENVRYISQRDKIFNIFKIFLTYFNVRKSIVILVKEMENIVLNYIFYRYLIVNYKF